MNRREIGFPAGDSNHGGSGEKAEPQPLHHRHRYLLSYFSEFLAEGQLIPAMYYIFLR